VTKIAIAIAAGMALLTILVWAILRWQARRHDERVQQRRIRQKGYRYAWDLVMGRKRHLMIEHHDSGE
jgi:hypothetical protein